MIQVGSIKSIGRATDYSYTLDDRQELIQTVNGAVAVDGWDGQRVSAGDVVSCKATFTKADAETIRNWWSGRTKQDVVLDNGDTINEARIIVRQINMVDGFYSSYQSLSLEFWKV